jgi:hypothetical protein
MRPIGGFTDEELAEYHLSWIPMLSYDDVPLLGGDLDLIVNALEEGVSADTVVLMLHELMDDQDDTVREYERDLATWRKRHPIRHLLSRIGRYLHLHYAYQGPKA